MLSYRAIAFVFFVYGRMLTYADVCSATVREPAQPLAQALILFQRVQPPVHAAPLGALADRASSSQTYIQHTSASESAYVSIRQHTSAYVSYSDRIRQHTSASET
jgi:hypothetical protein